MVSLSPEAWKARIDAIIHFDDNPAVRNLQITQCYHDLSTDLTAILGSENANWCTFATWASKTAGHFIRHEELPTIMRGTHEQSPYYHARGTLLHRQQFGADHETRGHSAFFLTIIDGIVHQVSSHIAAGNLKVFAELGPLFADLIAMFAHDRSYSPERLKQFNARLRPGFSEHCGQSMLRSAVAHFYEAMFTDDPHHKAELILHANAQTGFHEQIRLQSHIEGALNAPLAFILHGFTFEEAEYTHGSWLHHPFTSMFDAMIHPIVQRIFNFWHKFATHHLMDLTLPEGVLHLGDDLPKPKDKPLYPDVLQKIDDQELLKLLAPYKADDDDTSGSGADDWADLCERMEFILELFRSRQQETSLFDQPFTAAQRQAITKGILPAGEL